MSATCSVCGGAIPPDGAAYCLLPTCAVCDLDLRIIRLSRESHRSDALVSEAHRALQQAVSDHRQLLVGLDSLLTEREAL